MAHTNSTTNYSLPQFIPTDKPAWLTDINGAFSDIDTAVHNAQDKADTAFTNAGTAQGDATSALTNAAAADAKGSGALASIEAAFDPTTIYAVGAKVMYNSLLYRCTTAVVTPGPWTGSDNWERITVDNLISTTESKIGSLSSLATSDKTSAVNAINEVNGKTDNFIYTDASVTDFVAMFASIPNDKTVGFLMNAGTVSNCPIPYPTGIIAKWNDNTAFIELTGLNSPDATYIGRIFQGVLSWRKVSTVPA